MARSVGYGVVGLAMVLLGILIIVPFLKRVFPQLDGYVDYTSDVVSYMKTSTITNIPYMMTSSNEGLQARIDKVTVDLQSITDTASPSYKTGKNIPDSLLMVKNARSGDANSIATINSLLGYYGKGIWAPPPAKCGSLGTTSVQPNGDVIRIYTKAECDTLGGTYAGVATGECLVPTGGTWSWNCRYVVNTPDQQKLIKVETAAAKAAIADVSVGVTPSTAPATTTTAPATTTTAPTAAVMVPSTMAPTTGATALPSLSVNTAKPSTTLDLLKSACQSLIADTTVSLTGGSSMQAAGLVNTAPVK